MAEFDMVTIPDVHQVSDQLHVPFPNPAPFTDVSAVVVAWNEEARIGHLIELLQKWFSHVVVGVQQSTDKTREIAAGLLTREGDQLLDEPHRGFGDASFPRLVGAVQTQWTFVISCDELPDEELMQSMWTAVAYAQAARYRGIWIPFRSLIEGIEYEEQHGHLRLFLTEVGWPKTMHSRPNAGRSMWWPIGHIIHERSLDEMMQDYLRYYDIGRGNPQWEAHNRLMMRSACEGTAKVKGWDFVKSFSWWPRVKEIAFGEEEI